MSRTNVLLVDDENEVCQEFKTFLDRNGCQTITAPNALQALREVKKNPIDIVITDYHMPDINGIELLKELKSMEPELPVIMMSGAADMRTAVLALKENAFDFLEKPVGSKELLESLHRALARKTRREDQVSAANSNARYIGPVSHEILPDKPDISLVTLHAALDETNKKRMGDSVRKFLIDNDFQKKIILSLKDVNYINNVGLNYLIDLDTSLKSKGYDCILCMFSEPVYKYLKTLGYLNYFKTAATVTDATMLHN